MPLLKRLLKSQCIDIHKTYFLCINYFNYSPSLFVLLAFFSFICINLFTNLISNRLIFNFDTF